MGGFTEILDLPRGSACAPKKVCYAVPTGNATSIAARMPSIMVERKPLSCEDLLVSRTNKKLGSSIKTKLRSKIKLGLLEYINQYINWYTGDLDKLGF